VWHRPIIQYIEEPSLSALRVRQEKEEELKKLDENWRERLKKQEEEHSTRMRINDEEVKKTADKVEKMFKTSGKRNICRDERLAVMDCYSANAGQSLKCRDTVKSFVSCVNTERLQLIQNPGS
jgi:hypothetical protein